MIYRQPNIRMRSAADLNQRDREHYEVAQSLGATFTRADFVVRYRELYPARKTGSILPSDYCFNQENKGNHLYPRFLLCRGRSTYSFVGLTGEHADEVAPDALGTTRAVGDKASMAVTPAASGAQRPTPATIPSAADLLRLWQRIAACLDSGMPAWRKRVKDFGQVASVEQRQHGRKWSDREVFEAILRAVLSAATDWAKVESVLGELRTLFHDFDLCTFAAVSSTDIKDRFVPWFNLRGAGSQNLRRNLEALVRSAGQLCEWSRTHGSAENYFVAVVDATGGDPKAAALELGGYGRPAKLPGLGVPLAAETLRNLGFDVAKPDRHVNRATGAFGLVHFRDWKNRTGTKAPAASESEMSAVMNAVEQLAKSAQQSVCFVDNAVWLVCAQSGLYFTNDELAALRQ